MHQPPPRTPHPGRTAASLSTGPEDATTAPPRPDERLEGQRAPSCGSAPRSRHLLQPVTRSVYGPQSSLGRLDRRREEPRSSAGVAPAGLAAPHDGVSWRFPGAHDAVGCSPDGAFPTAASVRGVRLLLGRPHLWIYLWILNDLALVFGTNRRWNRRVTDHRRSRPPTDSALRPVRRRFMTVRS